MAESPEVEIERLTLERDLARVQAEVFRMELERLREQIRALQSRIARFLREGHL
jgi:CRISPR/Cas system-associated endoribonuclease Cas2